MMIQWMRSWPDLYKKKYSRVEGVKVLVSEPEDEVGPVSALLRGVGVAGKVHWETADTHNNLSLSCNHVRLKIHKLL